MIVFMSNLKFHFNYCMNFNLYMNIRNLVFALGKRYKYIFFHVTFRTGFGRSNEELVSTEYDVSPSPAHTKYSDQPQERADNSLYSRFHSNSLKSINTAGQSLKQKLSRKTKTLFKKYSSRSLECVLGESESSKALTNNYLSPTQKSSTVQRFSSEIEDMALLRRVESERRGPISEPR